MTLKEVLKLKKRNKYHAKKYVSFDGIEHDSVKEGKRWEELLLLQMAGEINTLLRQFPFTLLHSQRDKKGKVIERPIKYIADFTYYTKDGEYVVEDVKSDATKTDEYIIKRKLMLYFFGIRIKEV